MGPDAAAHEQLFRWIPLADSAGGSQGPLGCIVPGDAPQLAVPMA